MHAAYKNTILQQAPNEQDTQIETATMVTIAHFCAERATLLAHFFELYSMRLRQLMNQHFFWSGRRNAVPML